jgi:hypothetical protein
MNSTINDTTNTSRRRFVASLAAAALACTCLATATHAAEAADDPPPDPAAVQLLNDFMQALSVSDEDASAKATMKHVHKSLLNPAGDDLSSDLRRFSFKKAHDNAKFYASPVKITRIRKTGISAIGFKQTAEAGRVDDYFLAKKEGVNGMPAPVRVFFPKSGGAPKIAYMGSL